MSKQSGRCFAIGDVHGEVKALKTLISSLGLQKGDKLIFLGDYVDRGPDSKAVIDYLIELDDRYECTFVAGNHEEWMIAALNGNQEVVPYWLKYGGDTTLASYGALNIEELREVFPQPHVKFLNNMVLAHETSTHVFVHAGWDSKLKLEDQNAETLRYRFLKAVEPDPTFGKGIICGHSSMQSGYPAKKQNITCIDTIEKGWLTAYDIKNGGYHQASTNGQTRQFNKAEVFSNKRHTPKFTGKS